MSVIKQSYGARLDAGYIMTAALLIAGVMIADDLMIAVGAAAVVAAGALEWALFGVSSLFHVSLFAYLYIVFPRSVPDDPQRIGFATYVGVSLTYAFFDVPAKVPYVYSSTPDGGCSPATLCIVRKMQRSRRRTDRDCRAWCPAFQRNTHRPRVTASHVRRGD